MSSSEIMASENGKVIMVNDFVRLSNEFFGDGWEPTREMLASSAKEALNEIAGDDWELRHRCINRALANLRVVHEFRKQIIRNKKAAEEAASGVTSSNSATTNDVKTTMAP